MMEAHFELVRRQIEHHSGQEVKTMGDGFMVAFTSALRAVNCAVALQQALVEHNLSNPSEQVQVRIGLNTGEAIEKERDLFGSAVDAAARIMSKAAGGQILIPENTRDAIGAGEDVALLDRGPFWLKGFPERWRLYEVLWHEDRISTAVVLPHVGKRTPFVGRESERADLRSYLDNARSGQGSLVMIGGEPGVGKTRITEELIVEARQHGFLTLTGHCYEMEGAPPYVPFVEIIESTARIVESDAMLTTLGTDAPEVAKLMPELRHTFPDIPTPKQLPPEQERRRMFNGVLDFISRAAHVQPLLLVLEDLHWVDESTMLLLQHIVQRLQEIPVLVVGTYRDTELDVARSLAKALEELLRQRLAHDMILRRLPEADVSAMLCGHSEQEPPARLVELIYRETEGVPFFVEEIYKHLSEEGKLFDSEGQWHADLRVEETDVPRGVLLVIGRRLERVSEECRRILARAAVIGRGVGFELLNEVIELHEDTLFDAIEEAERAQLIRSTTRSGEAHIMFAHEFIRQALLSNLSTPRRQKLHVRVAEAMEQLYAGMLEDHAADLAYHFYQAGGDTEKIISYSVMAAKRASAQTAYEEAVDQYQRALQALELQRSFDELRRCDLLLALGHAFANAGDPVQAREVFLKVTEIARKLPAPEPFAEAVLGVMRFWVSTTDMTFVQQTLKLMEEGLDLLGDEDSVLRASLMGRLAYLLELSGIRSGKAQSEEALVMARRTGDPKALYHALFAGIWVWDRPLAERISDATELVKLEQETGYGIGDAEELMFLRHLHWVHGDIAASDAALDALKNRVAQTANPNAVYKLSLIEATQPQMEGRFETAEHKALEAFAAGQKVDVVNAAAVVGTYIWALRWLQGRLDEIEDRLQAEVIERGESPFISAVTAQCHLMLGREEQAREEFERLAANDFRDLPRNWLMPIMLMVLGELATGLGDTHRGAQIYEMLEGCHELLIVLGTNGACFGARSHWLGLLAGTVQRWDDAVKHFENAIEINTRVGARPFLARSQHEYARMLIQRNKSGDKDKAHTLLDEAIPTYRELGMPTFLEDAEKLINSL
jgi:tetratricopeptide (TPR) repeat protein